MYHFWDETLGWIFLGDILPVGRLALEIPVVVPEIPVVARGKPLVAREIPSVVQHKRQPWAEPRQAPEPQVISAWAQMAVAVVALLLRALPSVVQPEVAK